MSLEGLGGQWFSNLPRTGRIYRLIDDAGSDGDRESRIGAIIALGESGDPRAVDVLISCCRDRDPFIRGHAVEALGKIKSGRAVPALIQCLEDKAEQVSIRVCAVAALAAMRCDSSVGVLKNRLSDPDEDPAILSSIIKVMGGLRLR